MSESVMLYLLLQIFYIIKNTELNYVYIKKLKYSRKI
jgi:hypothetical protein